MRIEDMEFMKGFIRMCADGYQLGWHERNGGNLTYRIKAAELDELRDQLVADGCWQSIGAEVPTLADEYFLVTGSGKFFRNVAIDPLHSIGILQINERGDSYRIVWGLKDGGKPTSELPAHLMNHAVKKTATNGSHRVIYHAHTTNIIALTYVLPLQDAIFTRELWEMATECPVVFPDGVGVLAWMVPGGREIALATSELMKRYDVAIWAHHGMFASGESFDATFGLMHTVEKAAEILMKVYAVQKEKLQTIQVSEFQRLAEAFQVSLPEAFLYEH